jgi:hypothetical protein
MFWASSLKTLCTYLVLWRILQLYNLYRWYLTSRHMRTLGDRYLAEKPNTMILRGFPIESQQSKLSDRQSSTMPPTSTVRAPFISTSGKHLQSSPTSSHTGLQFITQSVTQSISLSSHPTAVTERLEAVSQSASAPGAGSLGHPSWADSQNQSPASSNSYTVAASPPFAPEVAQKNPIGDGTRFPSKFHWEQSETSNDQITDRRWATERTISHYKLDLQAKSTKLSTFDFRLPDASYNTHRDLFDCLVGIPNTESNISSREDFLEIAQKSLTVDAAHVKLWMKNLGPLYEHIISF